MSDSFAWTQFSSYLPATRLTRKDKNTVLQARAASHYIQTAATITPASANSVLKTSLFADYSPDAAYIDSQFQLPCSLTGDAAYGLKDTSGGAKNIVQSFVSDQPTFLSGTNDELVFNGSQWVQGSNNPGDTLTCYLVVKIASTAGSNQCFFTTKGNDTNVGWWHLTPYTSDVWQFSGGTPVTLTSGTYYILTCASTFFQVNNGPRNSVTNGFTGSTLLYLAFGNYSSGAQFLTPCSYKRLMVFNTIHGSTQSAIVQTYLNSLYNVY